VERLFQEIIQRLCGDALEAVSNLNRVIVSELLQRGLRSVSAEVILPTVYLPSLFWGGME